MRLLITFSISTCLQLFLLVLICQPFLGGFFNLIRLYSQEATFLFTKEKTARRVSEQIRRHEQLGRDSENSLCNSMTDGQVTFSQPPAWGIGMESTSPSTFWGMEITQAAPATVYGCPKVLLLSSFLFSAKLVCPGNTSWRKYTELVGSHYVKVLSMEMEKTQPFSLNKGLKSLLILCKIYHPCKQEGLKTPIRQKFLGHQGHHNQLKYPGHLYGPVTFRAVHEQCFLLLKEC